MPTPPSPAVTSGARLRSRQRQLTVWALVANFSVWGYVIWRVRPTVEPIPLHYTLYFGIDRVGAWYQTYVLPLAGTVVLAVNSVLAGTYRKREPLLGNLLAGVSLAVQLLLWIAALTLLR